MTKEERIEFRCSAEEKDEIKLLAQKSKRSISNFILFTILYGQSVDKTIVYREKEKGIERIKKQETRYISHIPEGVSKEVRHSIKNMFEDNEE